MKKPLQKPLSPPTAPNITNQDLGQLREKAAHLALKKPKKATQILKFWMDTPKKK